MQKLFNVGAYIRLSLKDTDYKDDSQSIESQQQMLSQFISMMPGWVEKRFYIDNGFSGGNFQRPAFQEMLEDVRSGFVNLIVVKDLSRFGRNYLESGKYLEKELPALGCRFVSLLDNIDTASETDGENDIIPFINGLNDYYLKNLSDRIKTVLTAKAKEGQYLAGETPYGYRRNPENHTRLIIDDYAADIVRKIYDMRADGTGYYSIARYLNEEKIMPPRLYYYTRQNRQPPKTCTKVWQQQIVKIILSNEIYLGHTTNQKYKTLSYRSNKVVERDKSEWIRVENTHVPIIEKSIWDVVQEKNQAAKKRSENNREPQQSLFAKLLICPDCGGLFAPNTEIHTRKTGREVRYTSYYCRTHIATGGAVCTRHTVYEITLKKIILAHIKSQAKMIELDESRMLSLLQERLIGTVKKTNTAKKRRDLEQKLHTIELQTAKLYEDRCDGILSEDRVSEMICDFEEKRKTIQSELDTLNQSENEKSAKLSDIQTWVRLIREKSAIETIEDLDRELLESLIEKIEIGECEVIDGEKCRDVRIYYRFVGLV